MIEKSKERNILLVDDEPDITTIMSKGMQSHGFNVDTFTDPASALSEFKPSYYDMIVLDIRMPGMNGFELARQIWAIDTSARIWFFSAFEIYRQEVDIMPNTLKAVSFVRKPITPGELAKCINEYLDDAG